MKINTKSRNFFFPLILIMLLPWINSINYIYIARNFNISINYQNIINDSIIHSFFIIIIWVFNGWLIRRNYTEKKTITSLKKIVSMFVFNLMILISFAIFVKESGVVKNASLSNMHYTTMIFKFSFVTLIIIYIQTFIVRSIESNKLKIAIANLQNENLEARLSVLKEQINPHFLFNTLSTLQFMIKEKDVNAEKFITTLSDTYRQLLNSNKSDTLSLEEECIFLDNYVFLMQVRFEDSLHFETNITSDKNKFHLPLLSLQMLVENAIKHNIASNAKPLKITIYQKDAGSITVENNFQPKLQEKNHSGIGLTNLKKRYEILQISNAVIIENTNDFFSVTLKLL